MKFQLDEKHSDIVSLIKQLQAAEQDNRAAKGDAELRSLLNRSAHMLEECHSLLVSTVHSMEEAAALRAGLMDSQSKHEEVSRAKNRAMETVAEFARSLLTQYTKPADSKARPAADEVI